MVSGKKGKKESKKDYKKRRKAAERAVVDAAIFWQFGPIEPLMIETLREAVNGLPHRLRKSTIRRLKALEKCQSKKKSKQSAAQPEPQAVDFSTVTVDEVFREQIYTELSFTSREKGCTTRAILSVYRAARTARIRGSDSPLLSFAIQPYENNSAYGSVDLQSLIHVCSSEDLQHLVRFRNGKGAFLGEKSLPLLQGFIAKAKEIALIDAEAGAAS